MVLHFLSQVKLEAHEQLKVRELVFKSNSDYIEITHEPDEEEKVNFYFLILNCTFIEGKASLACCSRMT